MSMTPRERAVYEMGLASAAAIGALEAMRINGMIPESVVDQIDGILDEYNRAKAIALAKPMTELSS